MDSGPVVSGQQFTVGGGLAVHGLIVAGNAGFLSAIPVCMLLSIVSVRWIHLSGICSQFCLSVVHCELRNAVMVIDGLWSIISSSFTVRMSSSVAYLSVSGLILKISSHQHHRITLHRLIVSFITVYGLYGSYLKFLTTRAE